MSVKWQHIKNELARKQGVKAARRRCLLCFEDSKSAPRYFRELRAHLRLSEETLIVDVDSTCSDPLGVVKRAIDRFKRLKQQGDFEEDDRVWAVVDVDEHTNLAAAQLLARDKNVSIAVSNPCFEYWILLHFEDTAPGIPNCTELITKYLRKHIPKYDKGTVDFASIVGNAALAAQRAERQFRAKAELDVTKCCPCTELYKFVQSLP